MYRSCRYTAGRTCIPRLQQIISLGLHTLHNGRALCHVFRCHLLGQHRPCCVCYDREGSALPDFYYSPREKSTVHTLYDGFYAIPIPQWLVFLVKTENSYPTPPNHSALPVSPVYSGVSFPSTYPPVVPSYLHFL